MCSVLTGESSGVDWTRNIYCLVPPLELLVQQLFDLGFLEPFPWLQVQALYPLIEVSAYTGFNIFIDLQQANVTWESVDIEKLNFWPRMEPVSASQACTILQRKVNILTWDIECVRVHKWIRLKTKIREGIERLTVYVYQQKGYSEDP